MLNEVKTRLMNSVPIEGLTICRSLVETQVSQTYGHFHSHMSMIEAFCLLRAVELQMLLDP